jgi:hypothetical protein
VLDANSEVPFNGLQRKKLQRQTRNQPNQTGHREVQIVHFPADAIRRTWGMKRHVLAYGIVGRSQHPQPH